MDLIKNRAVAFGAAGALAAGTALAGGIISPATAVEAPYTCVLSGTPTPLQIIGDMDLPSGPVAPGSDLGALPTSLGVTLPAPITTLLVGLGLTSANGSVSGAQFPIGNSGSSITSGTLALPSPVPLTAGAPATLEGVGTSTGTAPTTPGSYNVRMPSSFTFTSATGALPPIPCTTTAPVSLGVLEVLGGSADKESSTTTAKLLNAPVTTAERALVRVKVVDESGDPGAGNVVVKKGKKVLKKVTLSDAGKKRFRLPKLPRGENRIVFRYKGNDTTEASKVVKVIRVRRA